MSKSEGIGEISSLILTIAKAVVDNPEQVILNVTETPQTVLFTLSIAREDFGRVIGAKGQTIGAMRTLLYALGGKHKMRVILEVLE